MRKSMFLFKLKVSRAGKYNMFTSTTVENLLAKMHKIIASEDESYFVPSCYLDWLLIVLVHFPCFLNQLFLDFWN